MVVGAESSSSNVLMQSATSTSNTNIYTANLWSKIVAAEKLTTDYISQTCFYRNLARFNITRKCLLCNKSPLSKLFKFDSWLHYGNSGNYIQISVSNQVQHPNHSNRFLFRKYPSVSRTHERCYWLTLSLLNAWPCLYSDQTTPLAELHGWLSYRTVKPYFQPREWRGSTFQCCHNFLM